MKRQYKLVLQIIIGIVLLLLVALLIPFVANKYPLILAFGMVSFGITVILACIPAVYYGIKLDRYAQKHHFELWKKTKSHSLRERQNASRAIGRLNITSVEKVVTINRFTKRLFLVWAIVFALFSIAIVMMDKFNIQL